MKRKTVQITLIILLVMVLVLALARIILFNSVTVSFPAAKYVDDYSEFYLYRKDKNIRPFIDFGEGGSSGYKVWFLIGQKGKLLERIKEDVNADLTDLVADNRHTITGYEISDDFKKITIYLYRNAEPPLGIDLDTTIALKVSLYHEFIHGYGNSEIHENIVEFVESP